MKTQIRWLMALASLLCLAVLLAGCGGGSSSPVFLNVFQRVSWAQVPDGRLALSSFGGNGLLYIHSITAAGSGLTLLTPSLNNPANLLEGGQHPAYNPAGTLIAFASRRAVSGNTGASLALYTLNATTGDSAGVVKITDDTTLGSDSQPSWSPDGTRILYCSTRGTGIPHIRVANSDGSGGIADVVNDGNDNQWPSYNPVNTDQIVLQSNKDAVAEGDTNIFIYTVSTATYTPVAASPYADGGPAWSPDGTKIAFHSNRTGDFDIWIVEVATGALTHVTSDARSDGFPVWNADGTMLAFTRDRELWTCNLDGTNQKQLTRRF